MSDKNFKHGDKVYWTPRFTGTPSSRGELTVDYVLNDKEVWFTSGTWMPISQVFHVDEDKAFKFTPGTKVRSKRRHGCVLTILAEDGDQFWGIDSNGGRATYDKINFEPIPRWVPKVGDFVASYKIIAIAGDVVWVYDNNIDIQHIGQRNKFKTIDFIIALHELDVKGT